MPLVLPFCKADATLHRPTMPNKTRKPRTRSVSLSAVAGLVMMAREFRGVRARGVWTRTSRTEKPALRRPG